MAGGAAFGTGVAVLLAGVGWATRAPEVPEGERAAILVEGLLRDVYRAFDHRDEERIYDTLARSVTGELLERTYLEVRQGLVLANQGEPGPGSRVSRCSTSPPGPWRTGAPGSGPGAPGR